MGYNTAEFLDVMRQTLPVIRFDTIQMMLKQNDWPTLRILFDENLRDIPGGKYLEESWYYDLEADAVSDRWFKPGTVRQTRLTNNSVKGTVPIANGGYSVAYIEEETLANRSPAQIIDVIKARELTEKLRYFRGLVKDAWGYVDSSLDQTQLFGYPMWIVPITAAQMVANAGGAFQGANVASTVNSTLATTGSAGVDLSSSTYADLRNWNAGWTNSDGEIAQTDRVRIAETLYRLSFKAPNSMKDLEVPAFKKRVIFTNSTMWTSLGNVKEQLNDNIGADITKYRGSHLINGIPVERVDALDTADVDLRGTNPMYFINTDLIRLGVDKKKWMRKSKPQLTPNTTDSVSLFTDVRCQMMAQDPQKCGAVINWAE